MLVRCPHCHSPIELSGESSLSDIACPTCGSSFSLIGEDETAAYEAGTKTLGHFKLVEQIGAGTFGTVWKAKDVDLDRVVAVKIPRKGQLDASETEQFLREARAAAQLTHPSIVSVHEVGRQDDTVYIVSDFVEGVTLAERLLGQRFSAREAADLCAKIADALHHAHEAKVVHRDLKPANVILDSAGNPHIMDFGLARREAGEVTMTVEGRTLGTPAYMSPEQARGAAHTADRRTDVYSLGVVLFELLTGERPFRGSVRMMLHHVIHDEAPSPRKLASSIPKDLETICLKCLEKEPAKRYSTARELAEELRRFLAGESIHARPISRLARGWRWCKRNRLAAGLTVCVTFLLLTGLAVCSYFAVVANGRAVVASRRTKEAIEAGNRAAQAAEEARRQSYVSDMSSACQALQENNFLRLEQLLHRNKPSPGNRDLRGFEWYFLRRMCDQARENRRIELPYLCSRIVFSPDDDLLAIGLADHSLAIVRVHDQVLLDVSGPADYMWHPQPAFEFLCRGERLAYSLGEGLWLRDTRPTVQPARLVRPGKITDLAVSSDGAYLAVAGDGRRIQILTTDRFVPGKSLEPKGTGDCRDIAWSPIGSILACSYKDGTIYVWEAKDGTQLASLQEQRQGGGVLAFSPDGTLLASGANDNIVYVWDWKKAVLLHSLFSHIDHVFCVKFSPDGCLLASGSRDNTVVLWDVPSFQPVRTLRGHSAAVTGLAFSHRGDLLATSSSDRTVLLWELPRRQPPETVRVAPNHDGQFQRPRNITGLRFSNDGQTLAGICGRDRFVFPEEFSDATQEVMFWDVATGESLASLQARCNVFSLAFGGDDLLATGAEDGRIDLWNWRTRQAIRSLLGHTGILRDLSFSRDGKTLASGSDDGTVILWDVGAAGKEPIRLAHPGRVRAVAFSGDDSTLATGCDDRVIRLWDVKSQRLKASLPGHTSAVLSVVFSPDGHRLASSSWDKTIKVWTLGGEDAAPQTLNGHSMWVSALMFSHDGRTLFSASGDRKMKIWDVEMCQERFTLNGHSKGVTCMAISPDGNIVASGGRDGTIRFWRAAVHR